MGSVKENARPDHIHLWLSISQQSSMAYTVRLDEAMIRRSIQNLDKDERGQERGLFDDSFRGILVPLTLQVALIYLL